MGDKGTLVSPKPTPNTVTPAIPVVTPSQAETGLSLDCNGRNYAAHDRDCNKYYICQYGELIEQR